MPTVRVNKRLTRRARPHRIEAGQVDVQRIRFDELEWISGLIFDIEAVFLFAWAIVIPDVGWTGFWGAAVFILILLAGLLYDSRTGALDWAPESSSGRPRSPAG